MNRFWKQNRILISIVAIFLVLGIVPLVVMRFLPPEQPETASSETTPDNVTEEEIVVETATDDADLQHPFNRFLETSQEEQEKTDEINETKNNDKIVEDTNLIVTEKSIQPLESITQPEKNSPTPAKQEPVTIFPPIVPIPEVNQKKNDNPELPTPKPTSSEPVKTEPPKPQPPKPQPPKPQPVKPEPAKPEPVKTKPNIQKPIKPKIAETNKSLNMVPFLYYYQQSRSGHQTVIIFPVTSEHTPLIFEAKTSPPPTIVPVFPVVPIVPIIPVVPIIHIRPVYTPIIVPIIEYYPPLR
ncbi:MAG: hypothetical protein LBP87_04110 [Planctomycetaceae bacterium]|jgi:hypothetical protein|nr:hypothetical protein [Planctomycetaceae bacterium]